MSTQPTDEDDVQPGFSDTMYEQPKPAHNARIAAERERSRAGGWLSQEALDEYAKVEAEHRELREQLATEQEKLREERAKFHGDDYADMDAARNRILDLEQQLAAEREEFQRQLNAYKQLYEPMAKELAAERKKVADAYAEGRAVEQELREQLAADREKVVLATQMAKIESKRANEAEQKVQTLVDALKEALSDVETSNDPLSTCSKIRTALAKLGK